MSATVIIPARYGSTRFPAKIVAAETGKPLVQHVVEQAKKCRLVREVIVATDDGRIADALKPFGTKTVMTAATHQSGTDRIAEVARNLSDDIIVNVQGDEPEIEPGTIDALIERLQSHDDDMATAATPFGNAADVANPNLVKVVLGVQGRAIYFSRSPIPFVRDTVPMPSRSRAEDSASQGSSDKQNPLHLLHLGIYAYRREFLLQFAGWPPTPLEQAEKLEQLRAIEHGKSIFVLQIQRAVHGIDTAEQYAEFVKRHLANTARPGMK